MVRRTLMRFFPARRKEPIRVKVRVRVRFFAIGAEKFRPSSG